MGDSAIHHVFPYDPEHLGVSLDQWWRGQLQRWPLAAVARTTQASRSIVHVIASRSDVLHDRPQTPLRLVVHRTLYSNARRHAWGDDWALSLGRALRRTGPDDVVVVHQEGYAAGRLTMRYAHHARCVYVMHGRGASSLPVHEAADYSVVLNDDARDEMRAMGVPDSRVRQVVPSIDRTLFGPPGRSADLGLGREQGREQVVGCLGRIDPGKGIFELPDILRALADLDVRLELVGSPTDEAVARRVDEAFAGLPVDVLGELSPEQVSARMKVWTAMVMPSYAEGMPISALEALSSGVQLVGVTGVIPRSMAQRRGALVGPRESLAERVREALTQPQETETDWIPDHSDGARTWEEIYAALPSWRPRFRPSARPLVGRLTRMRRPRWAAPSR